MNSTVYVGHPMAWMSARRWPHDHVCHMFSEDVEALHRIAGRIGLKRSWFQNKPGFPHYDITKTKREAALKIGAVVADRRDEGNFGCRMRGQPERY